MEISGFAMAHFCLLLALASAQAQTPPQEERQALAQKAEQLLRHELGTWNSRWEYLRPDGQVGRVVEGTETFNPGPSDRIVIVETELPELDNKSVSIRFYHPIEQKIFFASVSQNGDFWLLTETVGSDVLTSQPHKNRDGSVSTIRFTTLEKSEDSMKVLMEQSRDGGQTWRPAFYQYLTRADSH